MVHIDYKHYSIQFEINKKITNKSTTRQIANTERDNITELEVDNTTKPTYAEGKKIVDEFKNNIIIVNNFSKELKVPRGDDDWYKHCGIVLRKFKKEYPEITEKKLFEFLAAHMIELLLYQDKLELMKYLYSLERIEKETFVWYLKEYFLRNTIVTKTMNAVILYNLNKRMIMLLNKNNIWVEAQPEDEIELANSKETKQFLETLDKNKYNKII